MSNGTVVPGVLLILPIAFVASEAFGYRGSPFGKSSFWRLPLGDKLDQIHQHRRAWQLVQLPWFASLTVTTAGLAGLAFLLNDVVGWMAFGGYVLAAATWLATVAQHGAAMPVAAEQREQTGETPGWAAAVWRVGQTHERVWVLLANLAAVGYGAAVIRTDLLPGWLGWAGVAVGLAIPAVVLLTGELFPHMALPVPLALGIALLLV